MSRALAKWMFLGALVVFALAVGVSVAIAQTTSATGPLVPLLTWSGVAACVGLVAEWGVRGWRQQRSEQDIARHDAEIENLARTIERSVPREEMERKLDRLEDRMMQTLEKIDRRLEGLFGSLGAERRKGRRE